MMTRGAQRLRALSPRRWIAIAVIVFALVLACGSAAFLTSPATAISATGPSATVEANGLVLTLRVAPGPYFLRELLPVSVSLTNHSSATVHAPRGTSMSGCGGAFYVAEDGGTAPRFDFPVAQGIPSCPFIFNELSIAPGQSFTASDLLLPLVASGQVTMTAQVEMEDAVTMPGGGSVVSRAPDPFAGHEPALSLDVAASAPPDRMLSLWRHTTRVVVYGPASALFHLRYTFTASAGGCGTGSFGWVPLSLPVLDAHPCAGHYGTWSYAVGAPGYAISSETVTF
jgi:hypothetical protein